MMIRVRLRKEVVERLRVAAREAGPFCLSDEIAWRLDQSFRLEGTLSAYPPLAQSDLSSQYTDVIDIFGQAT
jgi:hypothetical protein